MWARSLARSPDSKPLRATIERLTGTKMDPPEPPAAAREAEAAENRIRACAASRCRRRPPPVVRSRAVTRARRASRAGLVALARCWPAAAPRRRRRSSVPAPTRPGPQQRAGLEKLDRYGLNGRVAVAANGQGFSASLRYDSSCRALEPCARRAAGHRRPARRARGRGPAASRPAAARSSMATRRAPSSSGGSGSRCRWPSCAGGC